MDLQEKLWDLINERDDVMDDILFCNDFLESLYFNTIQPEYYNEAIKFIITRHNKDNDIINSNDRREIIYFTRENIVRLESLKRALNARIIRTKNRLNKRIKVIVEA